MTLNPSSLGSTSNNFLGKSQFSSDPYLNGLVDDFRIYSRALSATEIHTLAAPVPPSVAVAASASPNPVTGRTAALTVLGADTAGEANLSYTWTASGPAAVTFSVNGANAAKNTTATFTQAGSYTLTATIANAVGGTITSAVNVTVNQTVSGITIVPSAAILNIGSTQQFTAYYVDQFGLQIAGAISPIWSISPTTGAGTLSSSGLYTAPSTQVAPTITASISGFTGSTVVQVFNRDAWTNAAGGSWTTATNWQNTTIANGAGVAADFSMLPLTAAATVTLDGARTVGDLLFGDTSNAYGWTLNTGSAGPLTLSTTTGTPTIAVTNQTATIGATLAGSQGLTKTGNGTLILSAGNTYSGSTTVSGGTLVLNSPGFITYTGGQININGPSTLQITQSASPYRYDFGGKTFNFDSSGGGQIVTGSGLNWVWDSTNTFQTNGGANDLISGASTMNLNNGPGVNFNVARGADPLSDLTVAIAMGNSGGGLTKTGNGILLLTAANSYTGTTTVSGGTLMVANTAGSGTGTGAVTVNSSGTLGGTGSISGAVTVNSGGTLAPGSNDIGMLTINSTLALHGTAAMGISHSTGGCDRVTGATTLTYGGTLTVTNLAGTLANGDAFTLFTATTYSGSFSTINLPSLAAGLHWDTSALAASGQIKVVNDPPTVATAASATFSGTAFSLSVLAADDGGEANLTYTWSVANGPGGVTFDANGTNGAKDSIANLTQAGNYTFTATITDQGGLTTTSSTNVTVDQSFTNLILSPAAPSIPIGGTQQFAATALDQFGQPMSPQPAVTWTLVSGPGSLSSTGLYTPPYASGSATVQAGCPLAGGGSFAKTATVSFSGQAQWNASANDSWNTNGSWKDSIGGSIIAAPGTRGIAGDTVLFATATGPIARLDGANPTLAGLTFDSAAISYTVALGTGGSLTLQGSNGAAVSVLAGSHTISAPLHLASDTIFNSVAASGLTVSGPIDGSGGVTQTGSGTLTLSGSNTYAGGTVVGGGTLIVISPAALPDGSSLTVGAEAASIFNSMPVPTASPSKVLSPRAVAAVMAVGSKSTPDADWFKRSLRSSPAEFPFALSKDMTPGFSCRSNCASQRSLPSV